LISALHFIHQSGYFHGGLKIEDVVITESFNLKLIDFEQADVVDEEKPHQVSDDIKRCSEILLDILRNTREPSQALINFYNLICNGKRSEDLTAWYKADFIKDKSIEDYPLVASAIGKDDVQKLALEAKNIISETIKNYIT
jgi:serine/threonine protein kinase